MDELIFILIKTDPDTGIVKETTLQFVPDQWDENSITWERQVKYWGMARSVSIPLRWVKDGAEIIRSEFYTYGCQSLLRMKIKKLDKVHMTYWTIYEGKIEFKTYNDNDFYLEANVLDNNIWSILKEAMKSEYTIPLFNFENITDRDAIIMPITGTNVTPAMHPFTLLKWIVDKMTDGQIRSGTFNVKSSILEEGGYWYDKMLITTGGAFRMGQTDQAVPEANNNVIKTSFDDFFQSINKITPIGIGIERINGIQTLVLEDFKYFFENTIYVELGEVKNFTMKWNQEWLVSRVRLEYPDKDVEDALYTLHETNTYSEFRNVYHTFGNATKWELVSKYRADYSGIGMIINEFYFDENDTWDEDIFFVEVKESNRLVYEFADGFAKHKLPTGFSDAVAWGNCLFSPKRNFIRHLDMLGNFAYLINGYPYQFTSGRYYQHLNLTWSWHDQKFVEEYKEETIPSASVFLPFEISFEAPYGSEFVDITNNFNKYVIGFTYLGVHYTAYIKKIEINFAGRGTGKFTLIPTKNNNFDNLKR